MSCSVSVSIEEVASSRMRMLGSKARARPGPALADRGVEGAGEALDEGEGVDLARRPAHPLVVDGRFS